MTRKLSRITAWAFLGWALMAGPVVAQTGTASPAQQEEPGYEGQMRDSSLMDEEDEFRRFRVGGFGGGLSGATAVGAAENLSFRATFDQGSDTAWGGRVAYGFLPRFDVEAELGQASPGLDAVLTDLQGQGKTAVPFADMDFRYVSVSVVYHMIDRERLIVPFLLLGPAWVSVDSDTEPLIDATEFGLLFGGGVRFRPTGPVSLRVDVRGLRSRFGSEQNPAGDVPGLFDDQFGASVPGVLTGEFNATNLVWTVGLDVHF